jgi:hypothetical protein
MSVQLGVGVVEAPRLRVGDPQRDGPLGIPKGNRLFPLGSAPFFDRRQWKCFGEPGRSTHNGVCPARRSLTPRHHPRTLQL